VRALVLLLVPLTALACKPAPAEQAYCADEPRDPPQSPVAAPTYHGDVKPILDARCVRCHADGGIGGFSLAEYPIAAALSEEIHHATETREMPPFLAAPCCNDYRFDYSLTDDQIGVLHEWHLAGAPEGDPASSGAPLAAVGGLSRVDVLLTMPEPYTARPEEGRTDDFRCFLLDWPVTQDVWVTGLNPVPSNRSVVHHLIVGVLEGDQIAEFEEQDALSEEPGIPCEGGLGSIGQATVLGGSLLGADFPDGLGRQVSPDSKILLNVHYSVEFTDEVTDQLTLEMKIDDEGRPFRTMALADPTWLIGDALLIPAGESDVAYRYELRPTLYTRNRPVELYSANAHMHAYGSRFKMTVMRDDGSSECLLEIPTWEFGWEQPYWFAQPIRLEPQDRIYLECRFDNSLERQPTGDDGSFVPPRDIAWGEGNQDMCAAFVTFVEVDE
jgi:hypothetical protein